MFALFAVERLFCCRLSWWYRSSRWRRLCSVETFNGTAMMRFRSLERLQGYCNAQRTASVFCNWPQFSPLWPLRRTAIKRTRLPSLEAALSVIIRVGLSVRFLL